MGQNVTMMNVTINIFGDRRSRMWTYTTHEGVVIPTRSYEYIMNFFKHKITVLMNVVRFVTIRRPVTAFGIPGLIILIIGIVLAIQALKICAVTSAWSPTITLVSMMMLVMGMLLCSVAVILYAVAQMIGMMGRD